MPAEAVESLGQLPHLTSLSFYSYSGPGITAAHFTRLQSLTLHSVHHLRANWLPASVPHLQGLTELCLHNTFNSVSGADLGSLSELQSLRALWLDNQDDLQQACSILPCLTLLTRLRLASSPIKDEYLTGLQVRDSLELPLSSAAALCTLVLPPTHLPPYLPLRTPGTDGVGGAGSWR